MYPDLHPDSSKIRPLLQLSSEKILCQVRKKPIVFTPEEWVRQHILYWMNLNSLRFSRIKLEYPLSTSMGNVRADIVYLNSEAKPTILVECKAFTYKPTPIDLGQLARYLRLLSLESGLLTTGLRHWVLTGEKVREVSTDNLFRT